jgi:hypothetical protein
MYIKGVSPILATYHPPQLRRTVAAALYPEQGDASAFRIGRLQPEAFPVPDVMQ